MNKSVARVPVIIAVVHLFKQLSRVSEETPRAELIVSDRCLTRKLALTSDFFFFCGRRSSQTEA